MKRLIVCVLLGIATLSLLSHAAFARIGVGVNTGKIQVDEKLKAGMIYKLPSISVINTGDEPSEYEMSLAYHQDQPELKPKAEWFTFSPDKFYLEPGKGQSVDITLNLPIRIEQGNYFAYLEGHPVATVKKGGTTLGVAAASKLYFTVVPANIFYGIYYKIITFYRVYSPWPQRALMAVGVIIFLLLFKKFFNIQINVKKTKGISSINEDKNE